MAIQFWQRRQDQWNQCELFQVHLFILKYLSALVMYNRSPCAKWPHELSKFFMYVNFWLFVLFVLQFLFPYLIKHGSVNYCFNHSILSKFQILDYINLAKRHTLKLRVYRFLVKDAQKKLSGIFI